jgi:hypothetical protein
MESGLSMWSRAEITAKFAKAYVKAKADKGQILGQVVEVTGWSRDNARRRLTAAARPPGAGRQVAKRPRRQRKPKYSYDALKVLQKVWAASGGQCGRYLAASMAVQLAALERHGELVPGQDRYSLQVRAELMAMSSATIDRYLPGAKARDQIKGKSTTKASPLLRSSVKIRKATDEVETSPGFFEGDTVAHCGPTLKGEFGRTLNLTDVHIGWVWTRTVRNNAHTHILGALKTAVHEIPYEVTGLDNPGSIRPSKAGSLHPTGSPRKERMSSGVSARCSGTIAFAHSPTATTSSTASSASWRSCRPSTSRSPTYSNSTNSNAPAPDSNSPPARPPDSTTRPTPLWLGAS